MISPKKLLLFCVLFLCSAVRVQAQILWPQELSDWTSEEDIVQALADGKITSESAQILQELYEYPLAANSASLQDLLRLPNITQTQAQKWIVERNKKFFSSVQDLLQRGVLDFDQAESIKLFVVFDFPEQKMQETKNSWISRAEQKIKNLSGRFYHKTVARPDQDFESSQQLLDQDSSFTRDQTSLNLRDQTGAFSLALLFYGKERLQIIAGENPSAPLVQSQRDYALERYSVFWRALPDQKNYEDFYLKQIVIGNFKLGLYSSENFNREVGFFVDDTVLPNAQSKNGKNELPFFGAGVEFGGEFDRVSVFASKKKFPSSVWVSKKDFLTSELQQSSRVVSDVWQVQSVGTSFETQSYSAILNADVQAGIFLNHQQETLDVAGEKRLNESSLYWGGVFKSRWQDLRVQASFSRADLAANQVQDRNFYYFDLQQNFGSSVWTSSLKRVESGYRNRMGSLFASRHLWVLSQNWRQRWQNFSFELDYELGQREIEGFLFSGQKVETRFRLRPSSKILLQLLLRYKDPGQIYVSQSLNADGSLRAVNVSRFEQLFLSTRLQMDPLPWIQMRLDWSAQDNKRGGDAQRFFAWQTIQSQIFFKLNEMFKLGGGATYKDTDVDRADTETESFFLQLNSRLQKNIDLDLKWKNNHVVRRQSVTDENGITTDFDNPGSSNEFTVSFSYRW